MSPTPSPPIPASWESPDLGDKPANVGDMVDKFIDGANDSIKNSVAEAEAMAQKAETLTDELLKELQPSLKECGALDKPGQQSELEKYKEAVKDFSFRGARGKGTTSRGWFKQVATSGLCCTCQLQGSRGSVILLALVIL